MCGVRWFIGFVIASALAACSAPDVQVSDDPRGEAAKVVDKVRARFSSIELVQQVTVERLGIDRSSDELLRACVGGTLLAGAP